MPCEVFSCGECALGAGDQDEDQNEQDRHDAVTPLPVAVRLVGPEFPGPCLGGRVEDLLAQDRTHDRVPPEGPDERREHEQQHDAADHES